MIWGPPGTGKTHLSGHLLALYALAASAERPLRVFVTASTHHATVNVLAKLAELADAYGLGPDALAVAKLGNGERGRRRAPRPRRADREGAELAATLDGDARPVRRRGRDRVGAVQGAPRPEQGVRGPPPLRRRPRRRGLADDGAPGPHRPLRREADANVVLAGDDKQLPPIVHGTYPEEHDHLLSSVFALARRRAEDRGARADACSSSRGTSG